MSTIQKKRTFRKFSFRGLDLEGLQALKIEELAKVLNARARRRLSRGLKHPHLNLMKKIRKSLREKGDADKPKVVRTHRRDTLVLPEMVGAIVGIHYGKGYVNVEIKGEMVGSYLGEFSLSYTPVFHGRPGMGATHSSRFIPLK